MKSDETMRHFGTEGKKPVFGFEKRLENRKVTQRKLTKLPKCQKDANIQKGQKCPSRFNSTMATCKASYNRALKDHFV